MHRPRPRRVQRVRNYTDLCDFSDATPSICFDDHGSDELYLAADPTCLAPTYALAGRTWSTELRNAFAQRRKVAWVSLYTFGRRVGPSVRLPSSSCTTHGSARSHCTPALSFCSISFGKASPVLNDLPSADCRSLQEGGDRAETYFHRTACVAGVEDMRFQASHF
jgi:hypothetical protein